MGLKNVSDYYNQHVFDEDKRLDQHVFEMPLTLHFIEKYLEPGSTIFDVACGTGRYADVLLKKGYHVAVNDISSKSIEITRNRIGNNKNLLKNATGNALNTSLWKEYSWDAVLMLGPMYHLVEYQSRIDLLKKASAHIKKGGYLFTGFMTRTGALIYGIKNNPEGIRSPNGARKLWETGTDDDFVEATEWFTHAYFSHPEEIKKKKKKSGLEPLHLAGAEGIFGERFEEFHTLPEYLKNQWMQFVIDHCEDPHMLGHSKHLLSVSRQNKQVTRS